MMSIHAVGRLVLVALLHAGLSQAFNFGRKKRKERNGISAKSNKANPRRKRCAFVYAMGTLSGAEDG